MDAATEAGVGFAASLDGGYILPGFLPAFDAAASFVKLLELLALNERPAVRRRRPRCRSVHLAHEIGGHAVGAEGHGHAAASSS